MENYAIISMILQQKRNNLDIIILLILSGISVLVPAKFNDKKSNLNFVMILIVKNVTHI